MILAGTGHRPPRLGLGYDDASRKLLVDFVRDELARLGGVAEVISGMAQGFDQALAEASLSLEIPLIAAVPFVGMDAKWPGEARRRYETILGRAKWVHIVSEGGHANWKFAARDRWMVDHATDLIALFDEGETRSGTGITVKYAREKGIPVTNLWGAWDGR